MFLLNLNYSKSCLLAAFMQRFVFEVSCIYFSHATVACKIKKSKIDKMVSHRPFSNN